MKYFGLLFGVLLASMCRLTAQVTVEVALDQEQYLPGETLTAVVRITNRSGQTLHLGADEKWLKFNLESQNGFVVAKRGEAPVQGEFLLDSSKRAIKRVNLTPYFSISKPGRYTISANVTLADWKQELVSPPKQFDIIRGARLWEQEFGVPKASGPPEVRKYMLQQANYLRKGLMLYFVLADPESRPIKVFPIGPILSFGQPEEQVDKVSNLHVLYQDGPKAFDYTVFNPDGEVIVHQKYDYTSRPQLLVDADGNFRVAGGTRRITVADIPTTMNSDTNARKSAP